MQSIIYAIKKPKLLINYITLKDKLRNSLNISKSQINQFIKEYNSFKNYLEKKLWKPSSFNPYSYKRKGIVLYYKGNHAQDNS